MSGTQREKVVEKVDYAKTRRGANASIDQLRDSRILPWQIIGTVTYRQIERPAEVRRKGATVK